MEQIHKLELSKQQKIKMYILKLERYSSIIFLIILFIIAYLSIANSSGMIPRYIIPGIFLLLLICFTVIQSICLQIVRHQKKKWMNRYGKQITAVVTTTVVTRFWPIIYLEWCNPQTEKICHYKIVVPRSKLKLARGYEAGNQFPLWIDPNDQDFYCPDWSQIMKPPKSSENRIQMMKPPKSSVKIVWTYGTICGICSGMLWLILEHLVLSNIIGGVVWTTLRTSSIGTLSLVMGMLASKQTGRVRTGIQAGLVAGLIQGIIIAAFNMLVTRPNFSLGSVVIVVLALVAGAVIGGVGGLISCIISKILGQASNEP